MEENYNVSERINEVSIQNLKNALHEGAVKFSYKKVNGEIRDAYGTLNVEVMGEENMPHGGERSIGVLPENVIRYYDLNSKGWRSFKAENLISFENVNKS